MGINKQSPLGIREYEPLMLVSDNACQPTSSAFITNMFGTRNKTNIYNVLQSERKRGYRTIFSTLKEDLVWPCEFETYAEPDTRTIRKKIILLSIN